MKYTFMCRLYGAFYAGACKKELKVRFPVIECISDGSNFIILG